MMTKQATIQGRRLMLLSVGVIGAGVVLPAWWSRKAASDSELTPEMAQYAAFCTPVPSKAKVDESAQTDRTFRSMVPLDNPAIPVLSDASVKQIRQDETVTYVVDSPRNGALAVHGLSDLVIARPHSSVQVRFRAIYSGRFPLHFHGADGSHFEIAALEVLPVKG